MQRFERPRIVEELVAVELPQPRARNIRTSTDYIEMCEAVSEWLGDAMAADQPR